MKQLIKSELKALWQIVRVIVPAVAFFVFCCNYNF